MAFDIQQLLLGIFKYGASVSLQMKVHFEIYVKTLFVIPAIVFTS